MDFTYIIDWYGLPLKSLHMMEIEIEIEIWTMGIVLYANDLLVVLCFHRAFLA